MAVEIQQTTVTRGTAWDVVQLHISDAPPDDASASFALVLTTRVAKFEAPLQAQLQRVAMKRAADVLHDLLQRLAAEVRSTGLDLEPKQKKPVEKGKSLGDPL
jgi:hypothetical protein